RHRTANALEREFADRFYRYGLVNRQPNAGADQDLTGLGFIAKSGSDIGYCSDCGIVEAALKSNRAARRKRMCYSDPETKVVTKRAPFLNDPIDCFAHVESHEDCLECRVFYRDRIVEDHHDTIASKTFKGAAVLEDDLADGCVVIAQQGHHVFRV